MFYEFLMHFVYQLLIRDVACDCFLLSHRMPSILLMVSFAAWKKLFRLMQSHWFIFALVAFAFDVKSKNTIAKNQCKKAYTYVFFLEAL